jgi:hypothetical protein
VRVGAADPLLTGCSGMAAVSDWSRWPLITPPHVRLLDQRQIWASVALLNEAWSGDRPDCGVSGQHPPCRV